MRIAGYVLRTSPRVAAPEESARRVLDALPAWRPGTGEETLRARLAPGGKLIRWRRYRAAFLLEESPVGPSLVKVYTPRDALETAIEVFTPSRAFTSWRMGRALLAAGVPTPEPLLLLAKKTARIHRESILFAERLENAVVLLNELKERTAAGEKVRRLLEEAVALAADLHRAGFFHGDFTARNLVLHGPPESRRLAVIDLDRTKRLRFLPGPLLRRVQLLDLRMLLLTTWQFVSRRGWLRLFVLYSRRVGIPRGARKPLARLLLSARHGRIRLGAHRSPSVTTPWPDAR